MGRLRGLEGHERMVETMEKTTGNNSSSYDAYITALRKHQTDNGLTQAALAKALGGVSSSAVSQFLAGTYAAPHTLYPKIDALLTVTQQRELIPQDPPFVKTKIAASITNAIENAHLRGKVTLCVGDAGVGKTMTAREYQRNNRDAVIITISPAFSSVTESLSLLAERMNIKNSRGKGAHRELLESLSGTNHVIIVDEAQHLTLRAIEQFRSLSDQTRCGVVFMGNWKIQTKITGGANKGSGDYDQLYSRLVYPVKLRRGDIAREDITAIFGGYITDEAQLNLLHRVSAGTGYGLRGAVNLYIDTLLGYNIKNSAALSLKHLLTTAVNMDILTKLEAAEFNAKAGGAPKAAAEEENRVQEVA